MAVKLAPIQALRAYAAIMVVINHLWRNGELASTMGFDNIGGFGVYIFFVISGFIISYSLADKIDRFDNFLFLKKRMLRIFPMYLLVYSVFCLLYLHSVIVHGKEIDLSLLIENALLLPSFTGDANYRMLVYPAWTLVYEMLFYYVFFIMISISKNKTKAIILTTLAIVLDIFAMQFFHLQGPKLGWANFTYITGDPLMLYFVSGCVLYLAWAKWGGKTPFNLLTALAAFIVLTVISFTAPRTGYFQLLRFLIPTAIVAIHLFSDYGHGRVVEFIVFLGAASFSIYLFHPLIYETIVRVSWLSHLHGDLFGLVSVMAGILLGCLVYIFIEKPMNHFLLRRPTRRPVAA